MKHAPQNVAMEEASARPLRLIHRHAHDIRNQMNSMGMELMLLGESAGGSAVRESVARLQANLAAMDIVVKSLVVKFTPPEPVMVAAADLLQLWQIQVKPLLGPRREIAWSFAAPIASVRVDARAVVAGLTELTLAAWARSNGRPLTASLEVANGEAKVALHEPGQTSPLAPDLIGEMNRLVTLNGGHLDHVAAVDSAGWATALTFPSVASR